MTQNNQTGTRTWYFQSLSSRYAVVLGGYGPGYQELKEVEVVRHNKVCQGAIRYVKYRYSFGITEASLLNQLCHTKWAETVEI